MIISRIALFFALVFGIATTQLPEFVQQYRQRLGGAIDELSAIVTRFDDEAAAQGLSEAGGIAKLEGNPDPLAKARGEDMAAVVARLGKLKRAQSDLESSNPFIKWKTFLTTVDFPIASRAYEAYQPAVPTTADGFIAGFIGFVLGGGLIQLFSLPIRYRHKLFRGRSRLHAGASGGTAASFTGPTKGNRRD